MLTGSSYDRGSQNDSRKPFFVGAYQMLAETLCGSNQINNIACMQQATHLMFWVGEGVGMDGCRVIAAEILHIFKTYINFKLLGAKLLFLEH